MKSEDNGRLVVDDGLKDEGRNAGERWDGYILQARGGIGRTCFLSFDRI